MKRKLLFIVGLGTGYVMGTRAGRASYDKLAATTRRFWNDPRVTKVRDDVEGYARTQAPVIRDRAEAVAKAAPGAIAGAAREVADVTASTAKDVADRTVTVAKDVADKTATAAKDVADKAATAAKDIADKTTATAKSVADRVTGAADDVKDQVTKTATGIKDRGEDAVERVTLSVSEARDRTLEDDDGDENDDDLPRPDDTVIR